MQVHQRLTLTVGAVFVYCNLRSILVKVEARLTSNFEM